MRRRRTTTTTSSSSSSSICNRNKYVSSFTTVGGTCMRNILVLSLLFLLLFASNHLNVIQEVHAFSTPTPKPKSQHPTKTTTTTTKTYATTQTNSDKEIPGWWKSLWNIFPKQGKPGTPIGIGDFIFGIRENLEQNLFVELSKSNNDNNNNQTKEQAEQQKYFLVPTADVSVSSMQSDFFQNVKTLRSKYGSVFSMDLSVTKIIYIGDLLAIKKILLTSGSYDKGLVGFIGGDIFGEGLITALDRNVWRRRRKAVAPSLGAVNNNKSWLDGLIDDFVQCTMSSVVKLDSVAADAGAVGKKNAAATTTIPDTDTNATTAVESSATVDLEELCLAIALDALGVTVFGTKFEASSNIGTKGVGNAALVQAVTRVLKETNIRAEDPSSIVAAGLRPMWLAEMFFPKLKEFRDAYRLLDGKINELIADLKTIVEGEDSSTSNSSIPSILRILVESRDGETTSQQVKDDLVTLLIAGHETVGSVLTWTFYELLKNPTELKKVQDEIENVLGRNNNNNNNNSADGSSKIITMSDVTNLQATRRAITEALRMYPAPPVLSRRALQDEIVPLMVDGSSPPLRLKRGDNIFLNTAMLHRDPRLYGDDAEVFRPDRWLEPILSDPNITPGWNGYGGLETAEQQRSLYPSERATDFALIGFGAGEFKCLGDKFAFVEATIVLALLLQRYEFELVTEDVGFDMAGTIHTSNGLMVRVTKRERCEQTTLETSQSSILDGHNVSLATGA